MTNKAYDFFLDIIRISNKAMKKAQERNRRKGIPNVYAKNGKVCFELPNGKMTTVNPF